MIGGNPEALTGGNGQPIPQKILATNDDRIDLPGQALLPRWGYNSKPHDAGLLGERNIVVMARGGLWRGEADVLQRRGHGWSGWVQLISHDVVHSEGSDEFAAGIDDGKHIDFAAGFFHHGQGLAEGGGLVHNERSLRHDLGKR